MSALDLRSLDDEPRENFSEILQILRRSLRWVSLQIERVERDFLQDRSASVTLRVHQELIQSLLAVSNVGSVTSRVQLAEIYQKCGPDGHPSQQVETQKLVELKQIEERINQFVPDRFSGILDSLRRILFYMQKYCLSFYSAGTSVYLETGEQYERARQLSFQKAKTSVNLVSVLHEKWSGRNADGLSMADLSDDSRELCQRCDCQCAVFLFLVLECCAVCRSSVSAMCDWLTADQQYPSFLANDIGQAEARRQRQLEAQRDEHEQFYKLKFKRKQLLDDRDKLAVKLGKLINKEGELVNERNFLLQETNRIQIEIESKTLQKDGTWKLQTSNLKSVESINKLKEELPGLRRRLANVTYKLDWIDEQKEKAEQMEQLLRQTEQQLRQSLNAKTQLDDQFNHSLNVLEIAKQVHLCKTSNDTVRKIFYQQPVRSRKLLAGLHQGEDELETACLNVSQRIGFDWPELYRTLPFFPLRGTRTLERDISELGESRLNNGDCARRSLYRWRRHHTRARLCELREALRKLGRNDVWKDAEIDGNVQGVPVEEVEVDNPFAEEYLKPYLRQIEKFDKIPESNN